MTQQPRKPSQPSPKTNAAKPKPWPYKADGVRLDTIARLGDIDGYAKRINRAHADIDGVAERGLLAAQTGNWDLVRQAFADIRRDTADVRHWCADIRTKAGEAREALVAAAAGNYGE